MAFLLVLAAGGVGASAAIILALVIWRIHRRASRRWTDARIERVLRDMGKYGR